MAERIYITQEGEAWDEISRKVYGTEKLMHVLLEANPDLRHHLTLPGNTRIVCPEIEPRNLPEVLPPWKRP